MIAPSPSVELKLAEAAESDVGLGRVRIDKAARATLGVAEGAIVEIVGVNATAAIVHGLPEEDEGKGILRVDGLVRRNLGASIGGKVEVRKTEVLLAGRVTIAPIMIEGHKISFGEGIENFVKRGLLKRPVTKGDVVIVPGIALMGGALPFTVIRVIPKGIVQIVGDTIFEMREHPMMPKDLSPDEVLPELVRILRERTSPVLVAYADGLADMPGDQCESARRFIDAIRKLLDSAESGE